MGNARLTHAVIVFIVPNVRRTADFYREMLGFRVVEHYDKEETFAALYRDAIEIILIQSRYGDVLSNHERYGAGYDAYLDPETVEDVDAFYEEWKAKGVTIVRPPGLTSYGSYEFVFEDIDGRRIGLGRIRDNEAFFGKAGQ